MTDDAFISEPVIVIGFRRSGLESELSNLTPRPFVLDGIAFASIEGALQSLKAKDLADRDMLASLVGGKAWKVGQRFNAWKDDQTLFWNGDPVDRHGKEYSDLLDRIYAAAYNQSEPFRDQLRRSEGSRLFHDGVTDPRNTVLTPDEYISRLNRLRWGHLS